MDLSAHAFLQLLIQGNGGAGHGLGMAPLSTDEEAADGVELGAAGGGKASLRRGGSQQR